MQNGIETFSKFGSVMPEVEDTEMSDNSISRANEHLAQSLSGDGFVLVGYTPPFRSNHSVHAPKQISTGDLI